VEVSDAEGFDLLPEIDVDEAELEAANERQNLVEVVVPPGAQLVGETLATAAFRQQFDATVLALRRGRGVPQTHGPRLAANRGHSARPGIT
jgi:Trk K+ transport system NAD-binding subunit